ncbi:hypothetical protein DSO57_1029155 [Entomophthora muscae]|uniref:Uncharacterized protein n=2 Tax=Entomophthora muscae TaxID=34485 RepID=A0ACC2UMW9_9FUNG|nr:hypothetical protein DSO57_1038569 [Entomophthora muscae]KAJ9087836.1 hypothetical protein DSO57_1029155 [Entomophthora muscae]
MAERLARNPNSFVEVPNPGAGFQIEAAMTKAITRNLKGVAKDTAGTRLNADFENSDTMQVARRVGLRNLHRIGYKY